MSKDDGRCAVTPLYWVGGLISAAILIYLMIALLFPEKFS
jgi:K+-transporting ATPase KdpF subunit